MTLATAFDLRPDELLYSAIARYGDAMGYPRQRAVLAAAFGRETGVAVVDLPGRLDALVRQLAPGHGWTGADLAWRHTLLPYYAWCVPPERAARAVATMLTADGRTLHERLGVRPSTVPRPSRLRYCPACAAADRAAYGAAHWRRVHQAPGVFVCVDHDVPLRVSRVRVTNVEARLAFQSLERCAADDDPSALPADELATWGRNAVDVVRAVARDTAWLLTHAGPSAPECRAPGLARLWARCRRLLAAAGFVRPSGRLRLATLRDAFLARYGRALLSALGCALRTSDAGDDWLARLVRRPRVAQHPLHHLLVLHWLGVAVEYVFHGSDVPRGATRPSPHAPAEAPVSAGGPGDGRPAPPAARRHRPATTRDWDRRLRALVRDPGVSLREIGRRLGVTPRTVQRHARRLGVWRATWRTWARSGPGTARAATAEATDRRHRAAWRRVRRTHPEWSAAALRRAQPAAYAHLYRTDRAWLAAHQPEASHPVVRRARVDWAVRDTVLRGAAERAVRALLASDARPIRLCPTTIARRMGHAHLVAGRRDRLPATRAYLATVTESPAAFAARRVWWAAERCAAHGLVPARWALVRAAGLRPRLAAALAALIGRTLMVLRAVVGAGCPPGAPRPATAPAIA